MEVRDDQDDPPLARTAACRAVAPLPLGTKVARRACCSRSRWSRWRSCRRYADETPRLWGFPFFYWYQLLWVLLAAGLHLAPRTW